MKAIADLPARVPDHLVDEFLKRLPFVSDDITTARLMPDNARVAFELRAGSEHRASAVASYIADVADKLCREDRPHLSKTLAREDRLPSSFDRDPHPLLEQTGELVRFGRGRYGFGPRLTALIGAFDRRIRRLAAGFDAAPRIFPSLIGADVLDRCRYLRNFPTALTIAAHLREDHERLQAFARTACWDGSELAFDRGSLSGIECLLAPAVCFHWYASLADSKLAGSRTITAAGKCFRYESTNLVGLERLWDFTMRELVFVGTSEYVLARRDACVAACATLMEQLGLAYQISTATDPFFIDAYASQAAYQQGFDLKFELLLPLPYCGRTLAAGSLNYHQDFFGRSFAIDVDGTPAHTGCLGFGLERLALAFVAQHGVEQANWPAAVTAQIAEAGDGRDG